MTAPTATTASFAEFELTPSLRRIRSGVILSCLVLPLGSVVDLFMYPAQVAHFLAGRLAFGGAMFAVSLLMLTGWGIRRHRVVGVVLAMIPSACMAWIIHEADRAASPYYAGLNLVLLAIGLLLRWNVAQSIVATLLVLAMYVAVCLPLRGGEQAIFFNNLYFITLSGVIVVLGNTLQTRLRQREHAALTALELNRGELQAANHALAAKSAELQSANCSLEAGRAELEKSNARLRELDQLKRNFFANISHELRTPLTLILAPLDRLRESPVIRGDPDIRQGLETMQSNGFRLLKLINDLLDLVRLEAGTLRLDRRRIDVPSYLRGILLALQPAATEKNIRLVAEPADDAREVDADPHQLERVFFNLVFNAIKFTPAGGTITVAAAREGDRIVFRVTDTGIGISPEHLPRIFERFWQVDASAERKYQGAGIGLALVRDLTEAHGGSVAAESRPGTGTTILVRLPAPTGAPAERVAPRAPAPDAPAEAPDMQPEWLSGLYRRAELFPGIAPLRAASQTSHPTPSAAPRGAARLPRILVADDEPDMLVFLRTHLSAEYDVIEAVDGNAALTLAMQYLPEAVVCDMMMPEKNGLQVCRELQERPETREIPFLMLTARADDETKLTALSAGANDFLTKPFSSAELGARVRNLCNAHRLRRDVAWQNRKLQATLEQLKETELHLVQSEKLAALGRLSAGILHEINNPLNFARTALHTLRRRISALPEDARAPLEADFQDLADGVDRVVKIVGDMRRFARQDTADALTEVALRPVIDGALRFLAAEWKDRVTVEVRVPDEAVVWAHEGKLLQVVTNLLQNALDALASKAFPAGSAPLITVAYHRAAGLQVLRFRDNGPGIPSEVLGKIFDPFFTTKDVGKGTGLGLSICHRIMNEFGGDIHAASVPGEYTEFAMEFPAAMNHKAA